MPVTRKLSRIFKKNRQDETVDGTARGESPTLEAIPEDPVTNDSQDIDDILLAATQASSSLQDELARLETELQSQITNVSRLENELQNQTINVSRCELIASETAREIGYLKNLLISRESENSVLHTATEHAERRLEEQSAARAADQAVHSRLQDEKTGLENENHALQDDFRALHGLTLQYETWISKAKSSQSAQDAKIQELERRLALALQPMDELTRRLFDESIQWLTEKEELQARFDAETTSLNLQIQTLSDEASQRADQHNTECDTWRSRVSAIETALQVEQSEHRDSQIMIEALQTCHEEVQEDFDNAQSELQTVRSQLSNTMSQLRTLIGLNPTPRQLLCVKSVAGKYSQTRSDNRPYLIFARGCRVMDILDRDLDTPLEENSVIPFLDSTNPGSMDHDMVEALQLVYCPGCEQYKFSGVGPESLRRLSEYPQWFRQNKCSTYNHCTNCLKTGLKNAIVDDWWYELDTMSWLKCPDGCDTPLAIDEENLGDMLRDFNDVDIAMFKAIFGIARCLRESLASLDPRPGLEAISVSIGLHQQLRAFGVLNDVFNAAVDNPDTETPFNAGEVLMAQVERTDIKIPIFTALFRRTGAPKDCVVCVESFEEIDIESQERWLEACDGYHGPWTADVFSFPTQAVLRCDHDMDVCKNCIRRHLEAQLEQYGRNVQGRLTCPHCNRALSDAELRSLGSAETVQRYDHYLLLSHLSNEPDFRSCLNPDCDSGQIYDQDAHHPNPHISCDECDFEMCFTHQIPWHTGLSCDQYDSQRAHGDPDFLQTQTFMSTNCKACPGCSTRIEKGNACFHMTCTQCRHEFCWECLGDWSRINPQPGNYVKEAHNVGCWFRENNLEPTQISGSDLQEALRRRA